MKILQVVPYFPPAYAFGGPVKVAFQITRELVKRKHEVVVYTSDAKDLGLRLSVDPVEVVNGVEVHYFRNLALMPVKKSKLFITPQLISSVKEKLEEFDVVHLHEYRTFQNIVVHHYARKYGVPYVLQAHGSLPRIMAKQRLKWIYDEVFGYRLLRDASKVIAVSQMEAEQHRGTGVPEEKIEVIPNGIDLSEYANLPPKESFKKKFNINEDKKIILYLGRIHEMKGIDFLVKTYAYLIENMKYNNAVLAIAGPDDGYGKEAERLTHKLNLRKRVKFIGGLFGRDKLAAYVDADIIVNPSAYEIFGLTPLEAMMCERPVVVTSNCGCADFIQKVSGRYVIHYGDTSGFSARMMDLLENPPPAKTMQSIKKRVVDEFSWEKIVRQMEELYYSCVD